VEHPIVWTDSNGSRLRLIPTAWEVAQALVRLKLRHWRLATRAIPAGRGEIAAAVIEVETNRP